MIAVVDLGVSNVASVVRAFERVGGTVTVTTSGTDVDRAGAIVLPGVGAFRDGMQRLRDLGLVDAIRRAALEQAKPVAGICLGMQLLADVSEEHGRHEGLGLLPGTVERLVPDRPEYRVPNIGWCDLEVRRPSPVVPSDLDGRAAYFVHSFHLRCADPHDAVATIDYSGAPVVAAVERDNLLGVQFHPEKSQDVGLAVLDALLVTFTARATAA